jgi:hypothetical protein
LNPKKFFPIRTVLLFTVLLPFAAIDSFGKDQQIAKSMAETAKELIASLGPKKTAELVYRFENSSREHWHFFPNWSGRKGIPLSQLSKKQNGFIKELLHLLLTSEDFQEQENIRLIHGLRKDLTDPNNPMNLYYTAIFGTPSTNTTWGWRFEGHHLSLNCTLIHGKLFSVTPSFWGSSPVRTNNWEDHEIEVFEEEQTLSFSLVKSLTEGQNQSLIQIPFAFHTVLLPNHTSLTFVSSATNTLLNMTTKEETIFMLPGGTSTAILAGI